MMNTTTSAQRKRRRRELIRRRWLDGFSLFSLLAAFLLIFTAGILGVRGIPISQSASASLFTVPTATVTVTRVTATPAPTFTPFYTATPLPTVTQTPTITPTATLEALTIAIIVGHRNNDSGAICEGEPYEGLYEVDVTTAVTEHLMGKLTEQGHTVIDLDEYDERLAGLVADALVSIHADSCVDWEGTTGYKVAHVLNSAIPEVEDRFVGCMEQEYGAITNLPLHPYSVTHNMTRYHAFGKIDLNTPAIIIEVGFLFHDHDILTEQPDLVAEGIKKGIECFLYGEE